jgi:hypothetical protein
MRLEVAHDARPQVRLLLIALAVTVLLWFLPFADLVTYPIRLFVTFVHEGGHALAALLTGNRVLGLQVAPGGGGLTYTTGGGLAGLLVSSAGYLGAMAYGTLLLVLVRRAVAARAVLGGTAVLVLFLTLAFGWGSAFTLAVGVLLAAGLIAAGRFLSSRGANYLVAVLAVQCVMGALFDLRTLLFLSRPFAGGAQTDAANMAQATGIPAFVWAVLWALLALAMLVAALRAYVADRPAPLSRGSRGTYRRDRLPLA